MPVVAQVPAQHITGLLAPIDPAVPAGLFDVEDETYQAIDQEMVKLGGLQEASIDWVYIEEASRLYLSQQCKHLRIVSHLSVAWLRSGCWERWGYTLALLAGMVEHYWEPAHPKPGPKGFLGKRKLAALMLNRLIEALPRLDRFTYTPALAAAAQQALTCLQQQQGIAQLDAGLLGELQRLLSKHTAVADGVGEPAAPKAPAASIDVAPLAEVIATPMPRVSMGNERETRRSVLTMAELINQQDPYDPTGYQLRRFGLWAHLQAAPQARQGGNRTELMAVPLDIAGAYEDAIAGTVIDPGLLQRIEKSVAACPFWIRGSFLAATTASRLAMGEVAEAIRATTARFVQRMPALQQLGFSDGRVFVDDQCLAWLKGGQGQGEQGAPTHEFSGLREELVSQLESGGVEPVLLRLQALQADFRAPRDRCHTTVIAADLLAARGVSWLAQDLCAGVARTMQQTTADAWEPEVFQRLQQYATAPALANQNKDQEPS
ncbi:type VI secretion system protein TssA [Pseudomonas sp. P1B16]|jgi:type VI secretion-associated protein, VC_A0119 family|uniref:type VI secretion system protein TssA n=1 Tax=Pseudomonas TaxID=286 RepID=UPI0004D3437E|nr:MULTISPECIES: type VI secretion system protein TssA [Pseudomonas]KEY87943.1 membrane protein [Pseudomonas capeferrum]MCH7299925.1 type VI secretion system protein TssA [Pseudomonas capeferrum]MDD2062822.1 type VI secretion system protein TssA [Pseudomonas sp. 25571]MDD2129719.1 type VI secretion system protein TssA [Pseudomonas sp. 17391]UPL09231.1 type VI secretion-associated protein family, TssA [Pseudomonas sp. IsoF]